MRYEISEASKRFWDLVISVLTLIGAIAGALFAVQQYLDAKHKDRVANTIEYLKRYEEDPLAGNRRGIDDFLEIVRAGYIGKMVPGQPARNAATYVEIFREDIKNHPEMDLAIRNVIEFYEQLAICVNEQLCDGRIARKYFKTDAENMTIDVYPFICDVRDRWHNREYGSKMALFGLSKDVDPFCPAPVSPRR